MGSCETRRWWRLGAPAVLALASAELPHWAAARSVRRPALMGEAEWQAVLVLGYRSRRNGGLHPMQRWRTDIAVRSMHPQRGRLVFSGAGRSGGPVEAEVMARYVQEVLGVPGNRITVEGQARTTWENVQFSLEYLENAARITVASSPLHAARARRYLKQQRPDLADRLAAADDYRLGERPGWKLATVGYTVARAVVRGAVRDHFRGHPAR